MTYKTKYRCLSLRRSSSLSSIEYIYHVGALQKFRLLLTAVALTFSCYVTHFFDLRKARNIRNNVKTENLTLIWEKGRTKKKWKNINSRIFRWATGKCLINKPYIGQYSLLPIRNLMLKLQIDTLKTYLLMLFYLMRIRALSFIHMWNKLLFYGKWLTSLSFRKGIYFIGQLSR